MDKLWYIYAMEYYSAIKSMYTFYNTDEPWKHVDQAKWKKPDTRGHLLNDSIFF